MAEQDEQVFTSATGAEDRKAVAVLYLDRIDIDLKLIAERIKRMLLVHQGEPLTEELASERANNLAQVWPHLNLPDDEGEGGW